MSAARVSANLERRFILPIGGGGDRVRERLIHRSFVELPGDRSTDVAASGTATAYKGTGPDDIHIFRARGGEQVDCPPIPRLKLA